ncbi:predicted thioesterase [Solibacillus silvestris StLB046]|uniref:Predicted thioesterase n=1 Tax=Solibacillus silvestris (strain StLB046) TaxID=1002809 RepID=F2F9L1_SOLSS|nr:hypothetical protein [Solibacillus silvestris]BAK18009.1 predicted thioesterase [Solibacillus silvestris StLB046]
MLCYEKITDVALWLRLLADTVLKVESSGPKVDPFKRKVEFLAVKVEQIPYKVEPAIFIDNTSSKAKSHLM